MKLYSRPGRVVVALGLTFTVALAACGDSGTPSSTPTPVVVVVTATSASAEPSTRSYPRRDGRYFDRGTSADTHAALTDTDPACASLWGGKTPSVSVGRAR
jgi:hypothetical protein